MNMRIIMMISFLSYASMYAMSTCDQDQNIERVAMIKCIQPSNNLNYLALIEKAQEYFGQIDKNMPIVQLIYFNHMTRQKISGLKNRNEKMKKVGSLPREIVFCPLSLIQNFKEASRVQLGDKTLICDQRVIDAVNFQDKLALLYK